MTTYGATIVDENGANPVLGDHMSVTRTVTGIPTGDTLAKAWLTVKAKAAASDEDAALQLEITTSAAATGQITDNGDDDEEGAIAFVVAGASYALISAGRSYLYDIQVLTTAGVISTLETGTVRWEAEITRAVS